MDIVIRPIESLQAYSRNSRTHSSAQVAQLAASLQEFGWTNPILVDGDGTVLAGHGRIAAAKSLGMAEVPTISLAHLSEAKRRAYVIADNKLALNAGWDDDILKAELADLRAMGFDLDATGFSGDELLSMIDGVAPHAGKTDEDDVPDAPAAPISKLGDVWLVGDHRVMCGDSTDLASIDKLLAGDKADLLLTDPPYNVDYSGGTAAALKIENDNMTQVAFAAFLAAAFAAFAGALKPGAAFYVWHPDPGGLQFRAACEVAGLQVRQCLVWAKSMFVLGRQDYQWKHELCLYGWKDGARHRWYGGRKQTTVTELARGGASSPFLQRADGRWEVFVGDRQFIVSGDAVVEEVASSVLEFDKPSRSELHPTMKPVALFERQMCNSTRAGDVVLDGFGGSGTTLIAAEKHSRRARLMELGPKYCDVIVQRWEAFTGRSATLAGADATFSEIAEQRGT